MKRIWIILIGIILIAIMGTVSADNHDASDGTNDIRIIADNSRDIWVNQTTVAFTHYNMDGNYQTVKLPMNEVDRIYLYVGDSAGWWYDLTTVGIQWTSNSTWVENKVEDSLDSGAWNLWTLSDCFIDYNAAATYMIAASSESAILDWGIENSDVYANGQSSENAGWDYAFKVEGNTERYGGEVWRTIVGTDERNIYNGTAALHFNGSVRLKIPVSTSVVAISEVKNQSAWNNVYTEVAELSLCVNGTYYFDSANYFVYVGVNNICNGYTSNISVNCSHLGEFIMFLPDYKKVGDDINIRGIIYGLDGKLAHGRIAWCHIYYANDSIALGPAKWNITHGNFETTLPTTGLIPGVYTIKINFTDSAGNNLYCGNVLYLSATPVSGGVYSDATVYFSFYNTNEGLGLPWETLKIYIDDNRNYGTIYHGYIGEDVRVKVKDYYNNKMLDVNYTIETTKQFIDLGLTFHSWLFGNSNEDYYMISMRKSGGDRWWERGVIPYGEREFLIPSGTYCMRIYDRDNVEVYNSTLPESLVVANSRVYVIFGTNLSLIISGQSVIIGDLLEVQTGLDDATRPDIVKICYNLPSVYSTYDKSGQVLGTIQVCPAIIVMAETTNFTYLRSANTPLTSYPMIPTSDSDNGTITVKRDMLYLSGNASTTFINVSYGGNETNYTYTPNPIELFGENVTIWCDGNVSMTRITEYQSADDFEWTKWTDTEYYEATVDITNPFDNASDSNDTIRHVYIIMEFANDSTPDYDTVELYDVTNGEYLTRGLNYGVAASGIHWLLDSIAGNTTYSYRASYTAEEGEVTTSDAIKVVHDYTTATLNEDTYWFFTAQWTNKKSSSFLGPLDIQFNFTTPKPISRPSIRIYDADNVRWLAADEFSFHGGGITIIQDVIDVIAPNYARNFEVYFLYQDIISGGNGADEGPELEKKGTNPLSEKVIGDWPLGYIIAAFLAIIAALVHYNSKVKIFNKKGEQRFNTTALACIAAAGFIFLVTYAGV